MTGSHGVRGVASAAFDAGLAPRPLVAVVPLFGLAVTRCDTPLPRPSGRSQIVSFPAVIEFATAAVLVVGLPLDILGFSLGLLGRYGLRSVESSTGRVPDRFEP